MGSFKETLHNVFIGGTEIGRQVSTHEGFPYHQQHRYTLRQLQGAKSAQTCDL